MIERTRAGRASTGSSGADQTSARRPPSARDGAADRGVGRAWRWLVRGLAATAAAQGLGPPGVRALSGPVDPTALRFRDGPHPLLAEAQHIEVFNGHRPGNGTGSYHHHPFVGTNDAGWLFVAFTHGVWNEDTIGQKVLYRFSRDDGRSFEPNGTAGPVSLAPTLFEASSLFSMCAEAFLNVGGRLFATAETYVFGGPRGRTGYGRLAQELGPDGRLIGGPGWFTRCAHQPEDVAAYAPDSPLAAVLSQVDQQPAHVPAWSIEGSDHALRATDGQYLEEVTPAASHLDAAGKPYLFRFWRDVSNDNAQRLYLETTPGLGGTGWFPATLPPGRKVTLPTAARGRQTGPDPLLEYTIPAVRTNLTDAPSKSFLGACPSGAAFLVSNLQSGSRDPLFVSMSSAQAAPLSFDQSYILRANATSNFFPAGPQSYKSRGFQYPHAIIAQGWLFVAYSEDKENIHLTRVPVASLPGCPEPPL